MLVFIRPHLNSDYILLRDFNYFHVQSSCNTLIEDYAETV
jgi:hypothetical protein